jgi:hypothetical protein
MTLDDRKRRGKTLVTAGATIFLGSAALLWSWNIAVVDLFGLPEMDYHHALALGILIASTGGLLAMPRRITRPEQS